MIKNKVNPVAAEGASSWGGGGVIGEATFGRRQKTVFAHLCGGKKWGAAGRRADKLKARCWMDGQMRSLCTIHGL